MNSEEQYRVRSLYKAMLGAKRNDFAKVSYFVQSHIGCIFGTFPAQVSYSVHIQHRLHFLYISHSGFISHIYHEQFA